MNNPPTIDELWAQYLKASHQDETKMHPVQRSETKRAFVAGMGAALHAMLDIAALDESESCEVVEQLHQSILNFFLKEANQQN